MNYYVDVLTAERVVGWIVLPDEQPSLHILVDGRHVGDAVLGIPRPDVQAHFPASQAALLGGFEYSFQPADFSHCKGTVAKVAIVITPENSPPITLAASELPILAAPSRLEISGLARHLLSTARLRFLLEWHPSCSRSEEVRPRFGQPRRSMPQSRTLPILSIRAQGPWAGGTDITR